MNLPKAIALEAVLLSMLAAPKVLAYAQQEVDPSWYDPWASTGKVEARPAAKKLAEPKNQGKTGATQVAQHKAKTPVLVRAEGSQKTEQAKASANPLRF